MEIGWFIAKVKCRMGGGKESLNQYLRKKGISIGKGTKTASNIRTSEPYLISIGDNVTISHDVDFVTHDNSVCKLYGVGYDLYGRITVGNNCFIGAHAVIMYGVTIADNVIIAAGSLVTKSITESNVIVAGSPATIIGKWENFDKKHHDSAICTKGFSFEQKKKTLLDNQDKLIVR